MVEFCHITAVEKEGFEKRFLSDLVDRFNYLYARRPYNPIYAPACSPGLQNVRATVFALVDVIFIFAMEKQELMPSITTMCLQLLFSKVWGTTWAVYHKRIK